MSAKIHYQDNLYYLHSLIKTLESGMKLDIDGEYFTEKIVEDLLFIDASLMQVFSSLKDNAVLVGRLGYLRALRRTVNAFIALLESIAAKALPFASSLTVYQEKIASTARGQQRARAEIDAILDNPAEQNQHEELVSEQEFNGLLSDDGASD